jgi:hypothetical protein
MSENEHTRAFDAWIAATGVKENLRQKCKDPDRLDENLAHIRAMAECRPLQEEAEKRRNALLPRNPLTGRLVRSPDAKTSKDAQGNHPGRDLP